MAQAELHLQLHRRAWRQVPIYGGDAAGQAHGANFHAAILSEVDAEGHYWLLQADASMAALAHKTGVNEHFQRSQREIRFSQAASCDKITRPCPGQLLQRLQSGVAPLFPMRPAGKLLRLD